MIHNETILFTWESTEFNFIDKKKNWYWIVGGISIVLIIIAILLRNYLFAFLIGISGFLMITLAEKEPLSLGVEVSERGVKIHDQMYTYESILGFWITNNKKGEPLLLLLSNRKVSPIISIKISEGIDISLLREYISGFVPETEIRESFTDRIIDVIGF